MINRLTSWWRALTTSRYLRSLEATIDLQRAEIERLKLDNRGLLNSMLMRAGYSPIEDGVKVSAPVPHRPSWQQRQRQLEAEGEAQRLARLQADAKTSHAS